MGMSEDEKWRRVSRLLLIAGKCEFVAKRLSSKRVFSMHRPNVLKEFEKRAACYLRPRVGDLFGEMINQERIG